MSEEEIIKKAEYIIKNGKAYQGSITEYFVELYYLFNKEKEKSKNLEIELEIKKYCKVNELASDLIYYKNLAREYQGNCISKYKIKAKIEEVEQWELYNMKIPTLRTLDERRGAKIGIKYVLQSLLEEE